MTAWAVSDTHHEGRVAGDRLDIAVGKANALSAAEIEEAVRTHRASLVAPSAPVFGLPAAWALENVSHAGKSWRPGERVDLSPPTRDPFPQGGYVDVPPTVGAGMDAGALENALRNGLATLTDPDIKEHDDA
jgi:hypothetical protein